MRIQLVLLIECSSHGQLSPACCAAPQSPLQERWVSFIQQKVSEWQKGLRFEPKQGA